MGQNTRNKNVFYVQFHRPVQVCPVQIVVTTSWSQAWSKLLRQNLLVSFVGKSLVSSPLQVSKHSGRFAPTNRLVLLSVDYTLYQHTCNPAVTGFHPLCVLIQLYSCLILTCLLFCPHKNENTIFFSPFTLCNFSFFFHVHLDPQHCQLSA